MAGSLTVEPSSQQKKAEQKVLNDTAGAKASVNERERKDAAQKAAEKISQG